MSRGSSTNKRWLWPAAYFGFWTVLFLLATVETYIMQQKWDKPIPWALSFRRSAEEVYTYAALVLGVIWFARRIRFEVGRFWQWFLPHVAGWIIFSVSFVAIVSWLWAGQKSVQTGQVLGFLEVVQKLAVTCTLSNLFKYWIIVLGYLAWQYYKRYRERERQTAALATELVQARLHALRMQLNPHFLFNTLNTVLALIRENPDAAERMLIRLSRLLRRTLDEGENAEVSLRQEIEFLKMYLEIETMRFPDRLTVKYDIPESTQDLLVPQLILQPLVENALRHGILPREEAGHIEISARVRDGVLELAVLDNGIGLPESAETTLREGIGLSNVRSRLTHLYGSAQQFALRNSPVGGVEALVSIPCCTIPRSKAPRVLVVSEPPAANELETVPAAASAKPNCC